MINSFVSSSYLYKEFHIEELFLDGVHKIIGKLKLHNDLAVDF